MAKTQVGNDLEYFQRDAIGIWLGHTLKLSQNFFDEMRLEFGLDTL